MRQFATQKNYNNKKSRLANTQVVIDFDFYGVLPLFIAGIDFFDLADVVTYKFFCGVFYEP